VAEQVRRTSSFYEGVACNYDQLMRIEEVL